ncbi:MAG TPA: CHAT domain-containing protein, partial [Elusimicrobiota bacterium]|nr:CHAT domain-containing protein [Elusimicrobiota bacterium]
LLFPEPLPVDSIKLRPREVLVEYVVTRTVAIAFILKDGKLAAALDIPIGRGSLQAIVRTYLRSFQDIHAAKDLARYDPAAGLQVYRRIFEPVLQAKDAGGRPLIAKSDKLIIVPDDILGVLPFEALPTTAPARLEMPSGLYGPVPVGVSYVGDEYDIAYQRSATALTLQRMMRRGGNAASGLFVLADPIFSEADPRSKGLSEPMSEAKADVIETMGVGGLREQFSEKRLAGGPPLIPRLDRTGLMAEHLRDKVFAGEDVTLLEGASATKANLTPMAIEDKRYVVFATHGLVDGDLPGLTDPALLLTQYGGRSPSDGLLTMGEISKMRLNADLVALTACKTGLGRTVWGEGALSLGRAFQSAGARSVLISMWEVSEDSTNEFVERLFQHLKNGETSRKALRSARSEIRKLGYDHPYYWAPFVLTTD